MAGGLRSASSAEPGDMGAGTQMSALSPSLLSCGRLSSELQRFVLPDSSALQDVHSAPLLGLGLLGRNRLDSPATATTFASEGSWVCAAICLATEGDFPRLKQECQLPAADLFISLAGLFLSDGKPLTGWHFPCKAAGPSISLLSDTTGELLWPRVCACASSSVSSFVEGEDTHRDLRRDKELCLTTAHTAGRTAEGLGAP